MTKRIPTYVTTAAAWLVVASILCAVYGMLDFATDGLRASCREYLKARNSVGITAPVDIIGRAGYRAGWTAAVWMAMPFDARCDAVAVDGGAPLGDAAFKSPTVCDYYDDRSRLCCTWSGGWNNCVIVRR